MSSPETVLFPCPRCGIGRGAGGVPCKQCGWHPNAPIAPNPSPRAVKTRRTAQTQGSHGFLWTLVFLEIVACLAAWSIWLAILPLEDGRGFIPWGDPRLNERIGQALLFVVVTVGAGLILFCTSIVSIIVFAVALKTESGALKGAALLPLLASLPILIIGILVAFSLVVS